MICELCERVKSSVTSCEVSESSATYEHVDAIDVEDLHKVLHILTERRGDTKRGKRGRKGVTRVYGLAPLCSKRCEVFYENLSEM